MTEAAKNVSIKSEFGANKELYCDPNGRSARSPRPRLLHFLREAVEYSECF